MRRKFKLLNDRNNQIATILYFFEEAINSNIGVIILCDLSEYRISIFKNENVDEIIHNLAQQLNLTYEDYLEIN